MFPNEVRELKGESDGKKGGHHVRKNMMAFFFATISETSGKVGLQYFRNGNCAVFLLIVFQNSKQCPADCQAAAI